MLLSYTKTKRYGAKSNVDKSERFGLEFSNLFIPHSEIIDRNHFICKSDDLSIPLQLSPPL